MLNLEDARAFMIECFLASLRDEGGKLLPLLPLVENPLDLKKCDELLRNYRSICRGYNLQQLEEGISSLSFFGARFRSANGQAPSPRQLI